MSRGKHSFHFINFSLTKVLQQNLVKVCGSGGIRTHASEETGALNQRLRPLGHAILSLFEKKVEAIAHVRESYFKTYQDTTRLISSSQPLWHIIGIPQ